MDNELEIHTKKIRERKMPEFQDKKLQRFENPKPDKDYLIEIKIPEFTCLCPVTGQPDFALMNLKYIPNKFCVELKSLKLYIWSFRDTDGFHEAVTNLILDELVALTQPRFLKLRADFNVRGGTYPIITCIHKLEGWSAEGAASFLDLS